MSLRRPLVMAISGRYLSVAVQLAGSLVIARLLTPTDFGLFGIAASVIAVTASLREFGVTNYLVQVKEIDRLALGRGVAFTMGLSAAIGVPLVLARNLIAGYFGDPRIAPLLAILALNFVLVPMTIGAAAMLYRQMRLGVLHGINVVGVAIGTLGTIALAWHGFGPVSLAIGQIVQSFVLLVGLALFDARSVFCRPVFTGLAPMFRFGLFSALGYVVNQMGNYGTSIILGRMIGPSAVGYFERGNGLVLSVTNDLLGAITQVVYIGLTKAREDAALLSALLLRSLANLTVTLFPAFVLLAVLAEPVIVLLFGSQWLPSVPVLRVLALSGLVAVGYSVYGRLMVAFAETGRVFRVELIGQSLRLALVLGLAPFGLVAAACGTLAGSVAILGLYLEAARPFVRLRRRQVLAVYAQSLAVAAVTAVGPVLLILSGALAAHPLIVLVVAAALAGPVWLGVILAIRHPMGGELRSMAGQLGGRLRVALGWS